MKFSLPSPSSAGRWSAGICSSPACSGSSFYCPVGGGARHGWREDDWLDQLTRGRCSVSVFSCCLLRAHTLFQVRAPTLQTTHCQWEPPSLGLNSSDRHLRWYTRKQLSHGRTSPGRWHSKQYQSWLSLSHSCRGRHSTAQVWVTPPAPTCRPQQGRKLLFFFFYFLPPSSDTSSQVYQLDVWKDPVEAKHWRTVCCRSGENRRSDHLNAPIHQTLVLQEKADN